MLELDGKNYGSQVAQCRDTVLIGLCAGSERPLSEGFLQFAAVPIPGIRCCKLDILAQPELAGNLCLSAGGNGNPSLLLMERGTITQRFRGNYSREALRKILDLEALGE